MRLITTTQGHICLKETDDASGALLNMQGFAYDELYYRIRNGKIAFYLNNEDSPWKLEVWSINLPVNIDGVDYDEDNVDEAIRHIMADRFQEQIDELESGLTAETQRSVAADAVHDALISGLDADLTAEVARAQAEEYRIEHQFDDEFAGLHQEDVRLDQAITDVYEYASGVNAALAAEVTRSVAEDGEHDALISALTADLLAETSRATAEEHRIEHQFDNEFAGLHQKDVQHDTLISALTADLLAETTRATTAESGLQASISAEVTRSTAEDARLAQALNDEVLRATSAETALDEAVDAVDDKIDAEIVRSTAKDTEHDTLISGLTADLLAETTRATNAESGLQASISSEVTRSTAEDARLSQALNDEVLRASTAENSLSDRISANTASINAETARATTAETALASSKADKTELYALSGNTYTKSEVDTALATKADKASAFTFVEYNHNDKRIYFKSQNNVVVGQVDTTDFVKDGMVSNVVISGNDMVITFNTDAGKEDIVVSLANIFDPNNYYDKSVMNVLLAAKQDVSGMSAYALTANTYSKQEVDTALAAKADAVDVDSLSGKVETISGDTYSKAESDAKYQPKSGMTDYATTANTYTKTQVDAALSAKADAVDVAALSGKVETISGNTYTKTESDTKYQPKSGMSGYATTGTVNDAITQFTSALTREYERAEGAEQALSASKQDVLISGTNIKTINGNSLLGSGDLVISGGGDLSNYYTKTESDNKYQPKSGMTGYATTGTTEALNNGLTAHTSNQTIHVTATDKNTWNNKSDFSGNYNDLTNKPTIPVIWAGTQAEFDQIAVKDPNTIYLISQE